MEELLHAAVPKELGPEGRSERACHKDMLEGVQVGVGRGSRIEKGGGSSWSSIKD